MSISLQYPCSLRDYDLMRTGEKIKMSHLITVVSRFFVSMSMPEQWYDPQQQHQQQQMLYQQQFPGLPAVNGNNQHQNQHQFAAPYAQQAGGARDSSQARK